VKQRRNIPLPVGTMTAEYMAGLSLRDLARKYKVGRRTVTRRLIAAGVALRPAKSVAGKHTLPLPVVEIVGHYARGSSMATIAKMFGVAKRTIDVRLKAAGVHMRPRNHRPRLHIAGYGYLAAISRDGQSYAIHRAYWEALCGPIPKGWVIHHINRDKQDNRIENLMCMPRPMHRKLHAGTL